MADTKKETFTVEYGVPMKKEENVDESASPAVECMVKKEEGSTKDSNSGGAFAFSAKAEVKLEEKVLGVVKKEEEKVKKEEVTAAFPAGEENVVKKEEAVKREVDEEEDFDEEEDSLAWMAREDRLSDFEDEVRRDIWEITMEVKASEGLVERPVRAAHRKACTRCGYNSWSHGDTYYSSGGPSWAGSDEKFCKSCYREWLREDLEGYEVTGGVQSLRDELEKTARWREANNRPRRSEEWEPYYGDSFSSSSSSCFSDESEGESDESGGERSSKIRRTGD
ncbi:hypothetical protein BSKO_13747 [Bryopsis sp. KO-2023]|nr:hypothetical protein BSKO_13747 [Bryopsis sp. KO-2023]